MNKIKYLGMGKTIQDYPTRPHVIIQVLEHREPFLAILRKEDVTAKVRSERCAVDDFEVGGGDHKLNIANDLQELERQGNEFSPRTSRRNPVLMTLCF